MPGIIKQVNESFVAIKYLLTSYIYEMSLISKLWSTNRSNSN